ncbi:YheC/YheD family protein [Paenibacillus agilis]|uniref:YheC/YheD family protein n=1 Tax=Paenibacillus agilis TaxID=3020863 RepID=A0A559IXI2_9BACL|nr:YheC/YheD family protein [Paenibacillus agilis]TVX92316.1 YheC/YheD family protein [Paenibacillus agilis]
MSGASQPNLPVVAILTIDDDKDYFRGNRSNFADLLLAAKKMGYTSYIITIKDLKLQAKRVIGYRYVADKDEWRQEWFPLPHILYNRIPQREDEMQPAVKKKLQDIMKHPTIRMFNPTFFNKWKLYKWLNKSNATRPYIPHTLKLTNAEQLNKMLHHHSYLFLKPVSGKAGMGIMTLRLNLNNGFKYRLRIQDKSKNISYNCTSISKLWSRIIKQAGSAKYIVQQGITLASINKRPFDLRALIQKTEQGNWDITGIGARLAGSASITTHVPRGGSIEDPSKLLTSLFGEQGSARILARIRNTALVLARQIEQEAGKPLGEMSMDLGVDAAGGIWFFEANAKPMKFDEPDIRKRSLERVYQYSTFLMKSGG